MQSEKLPKAMSGLRRFAEVKQVVLLSIMPGYSMKRYMFTIVKQVVLL